MSQRMFTADVVVTGGSQLLLVQRKGQPYAGMWALPGGKRESGEGLEITAVRELREETGLVVTLAQLQHVGFFDRPGRDPRGDSVSTAFLLCLEVEQMPTVVAGDDAAAVRWWNLHDLPTLAFDHHYIVRQAFASIGRDVLPTLIGRRIYEVYRGLEPLAQPWEAMNDFAMMCYTNVAHILNEQLLLCEGCGKQQACLQDLHEIAGSLYCGTCIAPPPAVRASEYFAMAQSTAAWIEQASSTLSPEEQQWWRREQDALTRRAFAVLREARDEELRGKQEAQTPALPPASRGQEGDLRALLLDYYSHLAIGTSLEDAPVEEIEEWERGIAVLQARAETLLPALAPELPDEGRVDLDLPTEHPEGAA